ncbi:DUF806 family protein [Fructilactobacillus cliffordii]|uniref:DUF806 family protein n=1 Tax=Fructilactobacillus cliffordii TaxID=2940299 RepID=UPI002093F02D|nr:DUF806 family protein [Fructilactobacillus cliffordii]USS86493.1 DUF806 family protein [Fructilactobacillus cliffordii]
MTDDIVMPVVAAKRLLKSANFEWIDKIVQTTAGLDNDDAKNQTTAVISEVESEPYEDADNTFKNWTSVVEVQLFYAQNADFNLMRAEVDLARLFNNNDWQVARSEGHDVDPDTNQVMKTFYFRRTFFV